MSDTAVVLILTAILLPFCLVNLWEGARNLDSGLVEMGRSFTESRARIALRIEVPLLLPYLFAALRLSFSVGWKVALIAEFFGARKGIGIVMSRARQVFDTPTLFATVVVIVLIVFRGRTPYPRPSLESLLGTERRSKGLDMSQDAVAKSPVGSATSAVEFKGVSVRFGDLEVFSNFNLEVHQGDFVCLLGPSGCGKSTLLRVAGGLANALGTVALLGEGPTETRMQAAYVFQAPRLLPWRTALENVAVGRQLRFGGRLRAHLPSAGEQLRRVHLGDMADRRGYMLSGRGGAEGQHRTSPGHSTAGAVHGRTLQRPGRPGREKASVPTSWIFGTRRG